MEPETRNSELETPIDDPAALWLCQLPGLHSALLLRLLGRWGSAEAALRAPSAALREEGLPPGLVARFVAAPRDLPRIVDSLRGLRRLGIAALPLASSTYPQRLLQQAEPTPVVYVQGRWPLPGPVLLVLDGAPLGDDAAAAWADLAASIAAEAVIAAPEARAGIDNSVRLAGLASGILRAGSRLPRQLLSRVAAGQTTLLTTTPPGAQMSETAASASLAALASLADVVVLLGDAAAPPATGAAIFAWERAGHASGVRKLRRGKAGIRALRSALGVHKAGESTARQERLF